MERQKRLLVLLRSGKMMTSIRRMFQNQGLDPPNAEDAAVFAAQKRAKNVANAKEALERNGISFEQAFGNEFEVRYKNGRLIRYWPETGAWIDTKLEVPATRFGLRNLVIYLRGKVI